MLMRHLTLSWFFFIFPAKQKRKLIHVCQIIECLKDYRSTVEWLHLFESTWLELHIETISFAPKTSCLYFFIQALSHASVWSERHSIHLRNRPRSSHWRRWDEQQCCPFLSRTSITTWLAVHLASALAIHPFQGTELSSEVYYGPI